MKNGSEKHDKGSIKKGPVEKHKKEQHVVPAKKGNKPDPFAKGGK
jgi:hypothetical protein